MAAPTDPLLPRFTAHVTNGAVAVATADAAFIEACLAEARALVAQRVGGAEVPQPVTDRAVIEVGAELYHRRQAPNGISQFSAADGSAIRVARDPMVAAEMILRPFVPGGFA